MNARPQRTSANPAAGGFTFVEILAAMLLMAIVVPVALQGVMLSNRVGVAAMRKRQAMQLAEQTLNGQIVTGAWLDGDSSGDYGDDYAGFSWNLHAETWSEDENLDIVTVTVTYSVQGTDYTLTLSTLADPNEGATTTTTTASSSTTAS